MKVKTRSRTYRQCQPDDVPKQGIIKKKDIEKLYGCSLTTARRRYADYLPAPLNSQPALEGCFGKTSPLVWNAADVWQGYMRFAEARG